MKIKRTKLMRLTGKKYLLFFWWLLTAPSARLTDVGLNHERIHDRQAKELLYIFFYVWYLTEWIIRLIQFWRVGYAEYEKTGRIKIALKKLNKMAYRNISFEREAYQNERDLSYLDNRKRFAFLKYLA